MSRIGSSFWCWLQSQYAVGVAADDHQACGTVHRAHGGGVLGQGPSRPSGWRCGESSVRGPRRCGRSSGAVPFTRREPDFDHGDQVTAKQFLNDLPDPVAAQAATGVGQVGGGDVAGLVSGLDCTAVYGYLQVTLAVAVADYQPDWESLTWWTRAAASLSRRILAGQVARQRERARGLHRQCLASCKAS
jgi:hypothetical protein